ncbi:hypothetical protein [Plantactinospora sp. DSM 117369]
MLIGTVELVSILTDRLGIRHGPLAAIGSANLNQAGFVIVGFFVLAWVVAVAVWRLARVEQRWERPRLRVPEPTADT